MTLTGRVAEGVESGCKLLSSGGTNYLLLPSGDVTDADIPVGAQVTVRGTPQPDTMTTCQQGTPFRVTQVLPS